jgi:signal transduction histidine kinase
MIVRSAEAGAFVRVNAAFLEEAGFPEEELVAEPLLHWIEPSDRAALEAALDAGHGSCQVGHRTRSRGTLRLELEVKEGEDGPVVLGRRLEPAEPPEPDVSPAIESTFTATLATIARVVEEQMPGYRCSILLVADGRFVAGAGPSLPDDYNAAIDGYAIGPFVGSCGTAIYWNVPIIAVDIQNDPLWASFAELARNAGVAACWSHPFVSGNGKVLGALALYAPKPESPTPEQLSLLRAAARMTGLAVERGRAEEALREKRRRELELEEQLRQAAKMEALGVLAGGVAHDFNNVLAAILANAELALEIGPGNGDVTEMLRNIVDASKRAGGFCRQMLAYAGQGEVRVSTLDLNTLLPQVSALAQAALSKKVVLQYELPDRPIYVEGDENQLLQVFLNLVTNAAEAIGDERGRIVVGAEVVRREAASPELTSAHASLPPGDCVHLTVSDDGCGMEADTNERIFDPFFTTKFTGRGLGLAAVRGIVAKHQGSIHVDSVVGEGTTFTVVLPISASPGLDEPVEEPPPPAVAQRRVLVVDDEAMLRSVLARRLHHHGFEVVEPEDGEQALEVFRADPDSFDCVLLDLSMPKLSGQEVHKALVALRADVPIVLMSGYSEQQVLDRFKGAPPAGVLQKPMAAEELLAAIQEAMG